MDAIRKIQETYDSGAETFGGRYNSITTDQVHPGLLERLPVQRALDVGAGSGRDAKWLAERGFLVDAVDFSDGMLRVAKETNPHPNVNYFQDSLPKIKRVQLTGNGYDVIVLSAVWMHLKPEDRQEAFRNIMKVANPGAVVLITLRHGHSPEDRPMFEVSREELQRYAAMEMVRYQGMEDEAGGDQLGRGNVWWENVWLSTPKNHLDALATLKSQVMQGRMSSTYKPVFLLSLVEALRDQDVTAIDAARVEIPFGPVADAWQRIYLGAVEMGVVQHSRPNAKPDLALPFLNQKDLSREDFEKSIRGVMRNAGPLRHINDPLSGHRVFTTRRDEDGSWKLQMPRTMASAIDEYQPLVVSGAGESIRQFLNRPGMLGSQRAVGGFVQHALNGPKFMRF